MAWGTADIWGANPPMFGDFASTNDTRPERGPLRARSDVSARCGPAPYHEHRAQLVAVETDGVRLHVDAGTADVGGGRVLNQALLLPRSGGNRRSSRAGGRWWPGPSPWLRGSFERLNVGSVVANLGHRAGLDQPRQHRIRAKRPCADRRYSECLRGDPRPIEEVLPGSRAPQRRARWPQPPTSPGWVGEQFRTSI
jgi:hypothetical protein